ncbi:MAG: sugar phosphate isomerase/epimerase [Oscillospiraceae bacterium]|nr:sugar phosphate isomerase/epimerase [Oscillospiraceae bacterium]
MKYSISNIAWSKEYDNEMYAFLKQQGIDGLEIAPTRIFDKPYDNLELAHEYAWMLKNKYGLTVSSMQSIWYGVKESIFGTDEDRAYLLDYTKKAILFAESMGIRNLVFGCPRNRNMPEGDEKQFMEIAKAFFKELGDFAWEHNTVLAMEPNPVIYNTNFLNYTKDACEFVKSVDSPGFKVNIDMGTMIYNKENPHLVKTYKNWVNHIHISAPNLAVIAPCTEYKTLKKVLAKIEYDGFISIEMGNCNDIEKVKQAVMYLKEAF